MVEYIIEAIRNGETIDAEEARGYGQASRAFEARCTQWAELDSTVTVRWTNDHGRLIKSNK